MNENYGEAMIEIADTLNELRTSREKSTEYLTPVELGNYLNVSTSLVRKMILHGKIKPYRFGRCLRFSRDEIDQWITTQK